MSSPTQKPGRKTETQERYVDELADAETDYWLTITDAARATRRQDITIRRWVKSGRCRCGPKGWA